MNKTKSHRRLRADAREAAIRVSRRIGRRHIILAFGIACLAVTGCTQSGNVTHRAHVFSMEEAADDLVTDPAAIFLSNEDLPDRTYQSLGHLRVWVGRVLAVDRAQSEEELNQELRQEAARLGADAVINVRYGNRTVAEAQWLTLDATGTAVKFMD